MKIDLAALLPTKLKPYAKFVYAILGVAVLLVADGVLTGDAAHYVTLLAAVLTPAAVYQADNGTAGWSTPASDPQTDDAPSDPTA